MPSKKRKGRNRGRGQPQDSERSEQDNARESVQGYGEAETLPHQLQEMDLSNPRESESRCPQSGELTYPHSAPVTQELMEPPSSEPLTIEEMVLQPEEPSSSTSATAEPMAESVISEKPKSSYRIAVRPDFGTKGRSIELIGNFFLLQGEKKRTIMDLINLFEKNNIEFYHYDVDVIYVKSTRIGADDVPSNVPKLEIESPFIEVTYPKGRSLMDAGKSLREAREIAESKPYRTPHQQKRGAGKQRCQQIIAEFFKKDNSLPRYVYDRRKNLYTSKPLPFNNKKAEIQLQENNKHLHYEVMIKAVEKKYSKGNKISIDVLKDVYQHGSLVDLELLQDVTMAIETIMCNRTNDDQVRVGRSFFLFDQTRYGARLELNGMEIWFGYNQSVHLTQRGPAVVVNFTCKPFHKAGNVIEYAKQILGFDITGGIRNKSDFVKLSKALKGVMVKATHLNYNRKYKIKDITKVPAKELIIRVDGNSKTVKQYFQEKYNLPLKYPHLPCLHMQSNSNVTYIPMEVCEVLKGQPVVSKPADLPADATLAMIRRMAIKPINRFDAIKEEVKDVQENSKESLKSFGLFMNSEFIKFSGRVLHAPALAYNYSNVTYPEEKSGKWRMDGSTHQFLRTVEARWVLISFCDERYCMARDLHNFGNLFSNTARNIGLHLERIDFPLMHRRFDVLETLERIKEMDVSFALVILKSRDETYEKVKYFADIHLQLMTQCITNFTVRNIDFQKIINILLKVNSKIGGVNHKLLHRPVVFSRPIIILGADVTHSFNGPSIAALVGSMDIFPSRYAVSCRVQEHEDGRKMSQEIILDMKGMMKDMLDKFKGFVGKVPEKIVLFRDGVSDGQLSQALDYELLGIKEACHDVLNGYLPLVTFVVVQKKHQKRFIPKYPKDGVGKMGNIPAGTVIDTDVTHPRLFDFFLCSHEGIQGTSTPAHYIVIHDENNFNSDDLQQLCYHMCYTFVRCNRSISVPAPVRYAHLACTRARNYVKHLEGDDGSESSSGRSRLKPETVESIENMSNFRPGMFYV